MLEKICRVSGEKFVIEKEDLEFYAKMEIISAENLENLLSGKITNCAGLPTLCPTERMRRRLSFRNERVLYFRKCDATQEKIMSIYSKKSPFPVYKSTYWWGDEWEALDYGIEFDFNKTFLEQFEALFNTVPKMALAREESKMENSPYTNACGALKNCYLLFNADECEQCMYGSGVSESFDCLDCLKVIRSQGSYELISCTNCAFSTYLQNCVNCSDCNFCQNLIGCKNCFGSVNLRNKEFYFMNQKYTKEVYEKKIAEIYKNHSLTSLRKLFTDFSKKIPTKYGNIVNAENSTGDYLIRTKDSKDCFDCQKTENCKYCSDLFTASSVNSNSYDVSIFGYGLNFCYESTIIGYDSNEVKFSRNSWNVSNIDYCSSCANNTQNCFGCVGLKHKQYCILNKQYSKEEYEALVPKIIEHMQKTGEWGEFFPSELSPFAYNETVAQEYFPLTKEEAIERGYKWKEEDTKEYKKQTYVIPEDIKEVPESITNEILACERTGKNYQIQKAELKFYKKMNLPIPRLHPDERHKDRMKLRNPRRLWKRNCGDCQQELQTTFAPERPEKILCEDCYLKVVD